MYLRWGADAKKRRMKGVVSSPAHPECKEAYLWVSSYLLGRGWAASEGILNSTGKWLLTFPFILLYIHVPLTNSPSSNSKSLKIFSFYNPFSCFYIQVHIPVLEWFWENKDRSSRIRARGLNLMLTLHHGGTIARPKPGVVAQVAWYITQLESLVILTQKPNKKANSQIECSFGHSSTSNPKPHCLPRTVPQYA